jgi:hypothetical protein
MSDVAQQPQLTVSQRLVQLQQSRFLDCRHLVYLHYKKPDGSPLLTYEETLDDRDKVYNAIIQYELAQGTVLPDQQGQGQTIQSVSVQFTNPQQAEQPVVQGAPQMSQSFPGAMPQMPQQPQQQAPQPPQMAAPFGQPMQQAPQMFQQQPQQAPQQPQFQQQQPPQMFAQAPQQAPQMFQQQPVPQQFQQPQAPQQAAPQQMAPPQQEQPAQAPAGKGRGKMKNAVAPPPAGAPLIPATQQQTFAPPAQPQQAAPQQAPLQFAPPQQAPQQPQFSPPAASAPAATVDLTPLITRQDLMGTTIDSLARQQAQILENQNLILVAMHHLYSTHPTLGPTITNASNVSMFKEHLKRFPTSTP